MPKKAVRQTLLHQRQQLLPEAVELWGHRAQSRLLAHEVFRSARTIGLYSPIRKEVATDHLAHAARRHGQTLLYPRVCGQNLVLVEVVDPAQLRRGSFGVLEPQGDPWTATDRIDLLVVPGVAFDRQGWRLGYGQGYYDRFLGTRHQPAVLVGLCYDFQLLDRLPADVHDIPMDLIVTESETIAPHRPDTDRATTRSTDQRRSSPCK